MAAIVLKHQGSGTRRSVAGREDAPAATRLGYLLRTFPVLSETFVAGEIRAVAELTGEASVVAALFRPGQGQAGRTSDAGSGELLYWRDIDKKCLPGLCLGAGALLARRPRQAADALLRPRPGLTLTDRIRAIGLARYFASHGVTHIHSHFGWEQADLLAHLRRLAGLPYSLTLHAADIFVEPVHLVRRVAEVSFIATISAFNKRLLAERFGLPPGRLHVVHCGVDLAGLDPCAAPARSVPRLFSLGRMVAKKGFDVLLQAIARLRCEGVAVIAELAGDGPLRPQLMRLAGELGLGEHVVFPGALPPAEALARMREASVFALACQVAPDGDMDGIPVVLMEAMAVGRPVVSTRLSGIPELVADGCGLLAEPGDPRSLAQALKRVLESADLGGSLAEAGRHRVERHFTLAGQAGRIVELVRNVREAGGA